MFPLLQGVYSLLLLINHLNHKTGSIAFVYLEINLFLICLQKSKTYEMGDFNAKEKVANRV